MDGFFAEHLEDLAVYRLTIDSNSNSICTKSVTIYKIAVAFAWEPTPPKEPLIISILSNTDEESISLPGIFAGALVMKKVHLPRSRHFSANFSKSHISPIGQPQSANRL
jgi:hypothetical protein